jgi:hypothetical protein
MKKCPFCAEEIQEEAIKCKHCSSDLLFGDTTNNSATPVVENAETGRIRTLTCQQCGGEMVRKKVATNNSSACISFVLGLLCLLFFWPLGLILIIIALILGATSRKYWVCKKCSCKIEKL